MNNPCLFLTARRLRAMRRFAHNPDAAIAYEQALRAVLDEHLVGAADWHALFYGPQGEDNPVTDGPL